MPRSSAEHSKPSPMLAGNEVGRFSKDSLKNAVILPQASYLEVGTRRAVGLEAVLVEHPLRCDVVQQSRGFEAMQSEVAPGDLYACADSRSH